MVAFGKITLLAGVCALSMALFSCSRTTDDGQGTNRPPVIENLPTLERGKTSSASELLLRAQDPDGDPVRWSLDESDCSFGVSIFPEGKATWSCPAEEERCEVGVIVRDDSSASASGDFEIACVRSMGSFSGAAPETAREGEPYLYKAICEDEEGAALEVTHGEEDTCGGSLDEVNGQTHYRFTPGEEDGGSTCVLDLACGGETQRATITIVEVNLPPKITIENAVLTAQVGEQGHITFAVSDDDLPAQNITVEASPQGCDISPTVDGARVSWTCEEAVTCELVLEASDDFTPAASARTTAQIICTADTRPHLTELSISPTRPLPREALACQPTYSMGEGAPREYRFLWFDEAGEEIAGEQTLPWGSTRGDATYTCQAIDAASDEVVASASVMVRPLDIYKDIDASGSTLYPFSDRIDGSSLYVHASSNGDKELVITDGTAAGTRRVMAFPFYDGRYGVVSVLGLAGAYLSRGVFFNVNLSPRPGLWFTDGTTGGTVRLSPINAREVLGVHIQSDRFYFTLSDGLSGFELWVSDGTSAGTALVKELVPGHAAPTFRARGEANDFNGEFVFAADVGPGGWGIYTTDGTGAGTEQRIVLERDLLETEAPAVLAGNIIYPETTPATGAELFFSDGTPQGASLLLDLLPGPGDGVLQVHDEIVSGKLLFEGAPTDGTSELFATDGTVSGTVRLTFSSTDLAASRIESLAPVDGAPLYVARKLSSDNTRAEVWLTDGTPQGTRTIASPGSAVIDGASIEMDSFVTAGDKLFFFARNADGVRVLWVNQGADTTTRHVMDQIVDPSNSAQPIPGNALVAFGPSVYFAADDGVHGVELWRSDGTSAGTTLVEDIQQGSLSSQPSLWATSGNQLLLAASDGIHGRELWRSDGSAQGTALLDDHVIASRGANPNAFFQEDGRLFFTASRSGWRWTFEIDPMRPGEVVTHAYPYDFSHQMLPFWFNGALAISGLRFEGGWGLFSPPDTPYVLTDQRPTEFIIVDDKIIYERPDFNRSEIWMTDGVTSTRIGDDTFFVSSEFVELDDRVLFMGVQQGSTDQLRSISPSLRIIQDLGASCDLEGEGIDYHFLEAKTLIFTDATDGELWFTQGSPSSTYQLLDIVPGSAPSMPSDYTFFEKNKAFFSTLSQTQLRTQVWMTDGTTQGTILIEDIASTIADAEIEGLRYIDGKLLIGTQTFSGASVLYSLDLATNTLERLREGVSIDFRTRIATSTVVDDRLLFVARDGAHGTELWASDGTASGTGRVSDIFPGAEDSLRIESRWSWNGFHHIGDDIYFVADDGVRGGEVWFLEGTP